MLQVEPKADFDTIKSAYRKCVRQYHPDVNASPDADEHFKKISYAYQILSDERKRKQYDTMRAFSFGIPLEKLREKYADPATLNRLMKKVATGLAAAAGLFRGQKPKAGRDLKLTTSISFADSFTGTQVSIDYLQPVACTKCKGTGYSEIEPCRTCSGQGRLQSDSFAGIRKRCPRCVGRGWRGVEACAPCEGSGRVRNDRSVTVKIPAGVHDLQRIRVRERGEGGRGFGGSGKTGDLIVTVSLEPDDRFERSGIDLCANLATPFRTAAMGGRVEIEVPYGRIGIDVPPLTWDGRRLRVIGGGFPDVGRGSPGDSFFKVFIVEPESDVEKDLLARYNQEVRGAQAAPAEELKQELKKVFQREPIS